jgi:hypothetical protein
VLPTLFLQQILSFFGENIWEIFVFLVRIQLIFLFFGTISPNSPITQKLGENKPLVLGNFILLFLGQKFAKFSMSQNCKKTKNPGFGHFVWGIFKVKITKILHISKLKKQTPCLGEFSLAIYENIRQILNITELDKEKKIPGFGYIYRNQYFIYFLFLRCS